ncbi:hypothetical protein LOK49_LG15G02092 [Camellia lanceoleosa]|uniref:Uncharacterized protein n=1 Tax=Camellia lanceoleosa TaxID=1840588 RepID=A0ACC0F7E0_9ERIC|nr:hypothetical protein LOK49_LG15G02092 [Camellia lanceoleosa]
MNLFAKHNGEMEGAILEGGGDFLGKHQGFLVLSRLVNAKKDVKNNVVFVSRNYFSFEKKEALVSCWILEMAWWFTS